MFYVKKLIDGQWVDISSHTKKEDSIAQQERFVESGEPIEFLGFDTKSQRKILEKGKVVSLDEVKEIGKEKEKTKDSVL